MSEWKEELKRNLERAESPQWRDAVMKLATQCSGSLVSNVEIDALFSKLQSSSGWLSSKFELERTGDGFRMSRAGRSAGIWVPTLEVRFIDSRRLNIRFVEKSPGKSLQKNEESGLLRFNDGELLLEAKSDLDLSLNNHNVQIKKGTIITAKKEHGNWLIRNLHDCHQNSVRVNKVNIGPGQELILFSGKNSVDELNDSVGRRNIRRAALVQVSDFSLTSLIRSEKLFGLVSEDKSKEKHFAMTRVLKTAACLTLIVKNTEPYKVVD